MQIKRYYFCKMIIIIICFYFLRKEINLTYKLYDISNSIYKNVQLNRDDLIKNISYKSILFHNVIIHTRDMYYNRNCIEKRNNDDDDE